MSDLRVPLFNIAQSPLVAANMISHNRLPAPEEAEEKEEEEKEGEEKKEEEKEEEEK